jgi:GAF domain-containing protein
VEQFDEDVLSRASSRLAVVADFEELSRTTVQAARAIAGADGATFVVRDGDACFYLDEDAIAPLWKGQRFPIVDCISGWAMLEAEVTQVPDIRVDERIPQDAYRPTFVRSLVMVPIGTPPTGAVGLYWREPGRSLDAATVAAVERLAEAVAGALRRLDIRAAPWAPNFAFE